MSVKVMGKIWDLKLSHDELLVLLAMADHADHDGNNVYPSVGLTAWKTGYSDRQTQRIIKKLRAKKLLILTKPATPHAPHVYRINTDAGTLKDPFNKPKTNDIEGCQNVTSEITHKEAPKHSRGDTAMSGGDKMSSGDIAMTQRGDIAMSPKPSVNHHEEIHGESTRTQKPSRNKIEKQEQQSLSFAHPACGKYQELTGAKLNKIQADLIAVKITDLVRWENRVTLWIARGWNPKNVDGMVDFYSRDDIGSSNGTNNPGQPNGTGKMAAIAAAAENDRKQQEATQARYESPGAHLEGKNLDKERDKQILKERGKLWKE